MSIEFFVDQVPRERTVWDVIAAHPQMREAMRDVRVRKPRQGLVWTIPVALDVAQLLASYEACLREVGPPRGFANKEGIEGAYRSISLVFNPDHQDGLEPFFSTLGTPQNRAGQFYALARPEEQPQRKNSYWDTLGFRAVHPTITRHFGWFFERFARTLVRSRIATLVHTEPQKICAAGFNWHIDETPFCNLRMNIPLVTAPQYLLEIDSEHVPASQHGRAPPGRFERWRGHLEAGACYSWNTELPHRVFAEGAPPRDRVHIVLGFCPWFDWIEEERVWRSNEHFGVEHPYDMLDGLVAELAPAKGSDGGATTSRRIT
jgi:hypothetical protein